MKTLLLGDVSPTAVTAPLFRDKKKDILFGDVAEIFSDKDFVFANLECALTDHDVAIKKFGPPLKAPRQTAEVLKEMGVHCCGLSNNHIFDYGIQGAKDTLSALASVGLDATGFGKDYGDSRRNYTFEKNGERICIIAVCEHEYSYALDDRMGARPYDEYDTMEDIRAAKAEHDRVIVIYHGGKEHCSYPSPRIYKLCHAMARNGADVVLCQHSHCIGCYECYNGCHILYGQGNFHFVTESEHEGWFTALAVLYDTDQHEISFIPLRSEEQGVSLAKGEDARRIMDAFSERNESLLDGSWRDGWHRFCLENAERYRRVIQKACLEDSTEAQEARFGHFLDCEAHTDVWRELFPTYNLTNEK